MYELRLMDKDPMEITHEEFEAISKAIQKKGSAMLNRLGELIVSHQVKGITKLPSRKLAIEDGSKRVFEVIQIPGGWDYLEGYNSEGKIWLPLPVDKGYIFLTEDEYVERLYQEEQKRELPMPKEMKEFYHKPKFILTNDPTQTKRIANSAGQDPSGAKKELG